MTEIVTRMLPVGSPAPVLSGVQDEVEYSFAVEYDGPPVTYDIPRAVPIDVECIPTAAVAVAVSGVRMALPVVQPLPSAPILKRPSKDQAAQGSSSGPVVSPTSVIGFDADSVVECNGRQSSSDGLLDLLADANGIDAMEHSNNGNDRLGKMSAEIRDLEFCNDVNMSGESEIAKLERGGSSSDGMIQSLELLARESCGSGALGFSNHELSSEIGSPGVLTLSKRYGESMDFKLPDWASTESVLSSPFLSSEDSLIRGELSNGDLSEFQAGKGSAVTFWRVKSNDMDEMASTPNDAESVGERLETVRKTKKGACYRCQRGSRFTEKEACIVCNAKYCSSCVLRAMGSMPEGRKCVSCIGSPIDELRRESLGKFSRILKRLLSSLEIRLVMKAEKSCEVNQLQPQYILVNGKQLSREEMVLLQTCPHSPHKLKPGSYWYDKVSGLWGKEGRKPCQIITPNLNVGGSVLPNASNGNTKVFINNREITKAELRMLQWGGVQCAGNPHFWVNADGSYQEEGQKNIRGNIWGKAGIKVICSVLSLPVPSKAGIFSGEEVSNQTIRVVPEYLEQRILLKILLVGPQGSGTSTIFKQARFLYKDVPYSGEEREYIKCLIQSNAYKYLGILLEGRERFEEESLMEMSKTHICDQSSDSGDGSNRGNTTLYSIGPKLKAFSDWLLKVMASGNIEAIFPAATREYAPVVEELWKDVAIQATYSRKNELHMLPTCASYFLERVIDISKMEYEPSDTDILYAEGVTSSNGLTYTEFSFPHSDYDDITDASDHDESLLRYQLIRVQAIALGENCKWLEMFEDVRIVVFCVDLTDYDQVFNDASGTFTNKMLFNKKLFESVVVHPSFEQIDFLLILNKFDLLEQKIEQVPLTVCDWFHDFNPVISRNSADSNNNNGYSMAEQAFHYIAKSFKKLFYSLTGRRLYVSQTNGLITKSVDEAIRYAREIIKWEEDKTFLNVSEHSVFSAEASSLSP